MKIVGKRAEHKMKHDLAKDQPIWDYNKKHGAKSYEAMKHNEHIFRTKGKAKPKRKHHRLSEQKPKPRKIHFAKGEIVTGYHFKAKPSNLTLRAMARRAAEKSR